MLRDYCEKITKTIHAGDIVLIGGFSRSGKTTFSSILASSLKNEKKSHCVLSLDSWLRDKDDRSNGVLGRYDLSVVLNLIRNLKEKKKKITLEIPEYDKLMQKKIHKGFIVDIFPNDILIIEGVIALALSDVAPNAKCYYIEIDEKLRKLRVINEYLSRGKTREEADRIYLSRQADEIPVILKSSKNATLLNVQLLDKSL
jgi:uridine kinase